MIDKSVEEMKLAIAAWEKKGFSQFIIEPLYPVEASEEQYFSLERIRDGLRMLHAKGGGIDVEEHPGSVRDYMIGSDEDIDAVARQSSLPTDFLRGVVGVFDKNHFAFLEINPLVVRGNDVTALDAAVLVDSAGEFFVKDAWGSADVITPPAKHVSESNVAKLAATTPASLKLTVINPDGALFFLLSGGGGSIVIADEAQLQGVGGMIANYGEYSGGPTREETYLYAKELIELLMQSKSSRKALIIAGGVANFTDVKQTFLGIIDAIKERAQVLRKDGVKVFVRRGGPHEAAGLALMKDFLETEGLFGSVAGSDAVITSAIDEAIRFVRA